ncbi:MAG: hypothetical protein QGG38_00500 [Nitrospinaceae bacterium]|jgi:hypothetical protein|nr:hypothetical protein [Nitrospinaceae bacterium]MDP6657944.1 hypothetical protein [Nitrospinaceae bacterium]MDP6711151.1 hypothetical protein [Nitrospinaceae bacterium]MDP7057204.1 hypothetical protein [Nitrospinaceae bacterium]HAK37910.1 hypothetical protein [Nitrospina sp.]|tara:strand:- start:2514 stop:3464 length:951 start_codon:yes stop_codon:yes gene_type:complete
MMPPVIPQASGPVFTEDDRINLYYLNELYADIARCVSLQLKENHQLDIPITSGVWGGTYLIADDDGKAQRRIWRLYCIVNLPQNSPLDQRENMEHLVGYYYISIINAFRPYGLELDLDMWGGRLPYSNRKKPSLTLHMVDASKRVNWLRGFFIWNHVSWEESIIHDAIRNVKEFRENFNVKKKPIMKRDWKDIKFLLQDVIITYRTLENAFSPDFQENSQPVIDEMVNHFLEGLFDPALIRELFFKVRENKLIIGFEEALQESYSKENLNVRRVEDWPVEKINYVPEDLKEKLIPPIQNLFSSFKSTLDRNNGSSK